MNTTKPLLIIGVGNPLRRDDGVGAAVINQLAALDLSTDITLLIHPGEGLSLLESWREYPRVIIIDATRSDQTPGTIQRFIIDYNTVLPRDLFHASSHLFGVAEAVALAQSLKRLPANLVIYGIEGLDFSYGEGLTPLVQKAVLQTTEWLQTELGLVKLHD